MYYFFSACQAHIYILGGALFEKKRLEKFLKNERNLNQNTIKSFTKPGSII